MDVPPEMIRSAQSGDRQAMEDLIKGSYRAAYTLALRLLGNPDDAAEATQETYIRVVRGLKRLGEPDAFPTWLFKITSNVCISEMRRRTRRDIPTENVAEHEASPVDVEAVVTGRVAAEELEQLMRQLPEAYRTVIVLRDVYDMSGDEAAEILGVTPGAVKVRLHRARRRLRDELVARFPEWASSEGPQEKVIA
ncbi:MAG TPA: RNA polymerase sigma factor [Actinomycetota bacterium]|nr:RNA polymerase sigma factor [Actinomycetota bacterium]